MLKQPATPRDERTAHQRIIWDAACNTTSGTSVSTWRWYEPNRWHAIWQYLLDDNDYDFGHLPKLVKHEEIDMEFRAAIMIMENQAEAERLIAHLKETEFVQVLCCSPIA